MAPAICRHGNCSICSSCADINMHELDYIAPTIGPYLQKSRASSWSPPSLASMGACFSCGAMAHIHPHRYSAIHILPSGQAVTYVPEHRLAQLVFSIKSFSTPIYSRTFLSEVPLQEEISSISTATSSCSDSSLQAAYRNWSLTPARQERWSGRAARFCMWCLATLRSSCALR